MLSFLISLLSFAFVITILVFIHELGHYLAARSVGMRVEKFSVGFPPRFLSFTSQPGGWNFRIFFYKRNEKSKLVWSQVFNKFISSPKKKGTGTEYCLALLPLGGYVKVSGILDESMDPNSTGADYEYQSKKTWQKLWFTSAGVIFNFILAFIILGFSYMYSGYSTNKLGGTLESIESIDLENIQILMGGNKDYYKLKKEDSFSTSILYSSIPNTTAIDTINGLIELEKSMGNFILQNLREKDIIGVKFSLPLKINTIDSIIINDNTYSKNLEILVDDKDSLIQISIKDTTGSKILSNQFVDLGTIYHNTISHKKSPAFEVGLNKGDRILSIDDMNVNYFVDIENILSEKAEDNSKKDRISNLNFEISDQNGNIENISIIPQFFEEYNLIKKPIKKYKIGAYFSKEQLGFFESFYRSGYETINSKQFGIITTFKNIFYLITMQLDLEMMSGPIGIAKISGQVASSGEGWFLNLLQLMAFLSISLGVINILPLPGLDGGHALIAIIEKLKGGKLSAKLQIRIQQVGMLLLMSLFIYIIFKDFIKIIF